MDCGIPVPVAPFSSFSRQRSQNHTSPFVAQRRFPDVSFFRGTRARAKDKGKRKRRETSLRHSLSLSLPWSFALRARCQSHVLSARPCLADRSVWGGGRPKAMTVTGTFREKKKRGFIFHIQIYVLTLINSEFPVVAYVFQNTQNWSSHFVLGKTDLNM